MTRHSDFCICSQCEWDESPTQEWAPTWVDVKVQDLFDCSDVDTMAPAVFVEAL